MDLFVELFYAGEPVQFDQPQSFTCPYCGKIGMSETRLHEHVTGEHLSSSSEVVRKYLELVIIVITRFKDFSS